MAESTFKVVRGDTPATAKDSVAPGSASHAAPPTTDAGNPPGRRRLRFVLLLVVPLLAVAIGACFYLSSGHVISTDNAYVGAQKVLITPDVSGKIANVAVREGARVKAGDKLFEIDPQPYRLATDQATARLDSVRTDFANLKTNVQSLNTLVDLGERNVEIKQRDVDRKTTLAKSAAGSQAELDNAMAAVVAAKLQAQYATQQRDNALNQLRGKLDLPIEAFPAYQQARAALEQAQRDLDHTVLRAPIEGIATQVDNIQLGRFVTAGTPVFSVVDDSAPWVDANPKETDVTNLKVGQKANVWIDTFPDHAFTGTVQSVSPGTGSQFAILPPQNASGNWVKVVQRVPVRIRLDNGADMQGLRAGMSATVEIDTGADDRSTTGSGASAVR